MKKLRKRTSAVTGCVTMVASMAACGAKSGTQIKSAQTKAVAQTETTAQTETSAQAGMEGDKMTTDYGNMKDIGIKMEPIELTDEWDKVFPLSDEVNHRKVTFVNRSGITLAADFYEPKEYTGKLPAIAVCGPFGAAKEQSFGLYAQELAKKGFLAISFDPSFIGENAGYSRDSNSPDINIENYQAAVDFLFIQENVGSEKIGIIGIYGWGGMAVQTAALDIRIKAMVAMMMYGMSRDTVLGYLDSVGEEGKYEVRAACDHQRTEDYKNGFYTMGGELPEEVSEEAPQYVKGCATYHRTKRGYHPRSANADNGWAVTASGSLMNIQPFEYAPEIRSAALLVHGEETHSLMYSQEVYKLPQGDNKELTIIPGVSHTNLYDRMDIILFDKLETFFHDAFAQQLRIIQEAVNSKE